MDGWDMRCAFIAQPFCCAFNSSMPIVHALDHPLSKLRGQRGCIKLPPRPSPDPGSLRVRGLRLGGGTLEMRWRAEGMTAEG